MGIALVPRLSRALSEQINAYYRILRGVDADSIYFRLNNGGSFEVRHSATNAAVFAVTDAGANLVVETGDIQDGAVTSAKILDGTIMNAGVNAAAAIAGSKLAAQSVTATQIADGTITSTQIVPGGIGGTSLTPGTVTSNEIADGTIVNADVNAAAGIVVSKLAAGGATNRVVRTTDGVTMQMDTVKAADMAAGGLNSVLTTGPGGVVGWGAISSAMIADGSIVNADIAAVGTANIDGAKLAVASIPSDRLISGGGIPAESITTTE